MKIKLILTFAILLVSVFGYSQSCGNSNVKYPRYVTVQGIINTATRDTLCWYWSRAETIAYFASSGGLLSLAQGKFLIGSNTGLAAARTISGDLTFSYLGVGVVDSLKFITKLLDKKRIDSIGAIALAKQSPATTLAGYGITDAYPLVSNPAGYLTTLAFSSLTGKPTTIAGYGITDAVFMSDTAIASPGVNTSFVKTIPSGKTYCIASSASPSLIVVTGCSISGTTMTITCAAASVGAAAINLTYIYK